MTIYSMCRILFWFLLHTLGSIPINKLSLIIKIRMLDLRQSLFALLRTVLRRNPTSSHDTLSDSDGKLYHRSACVTGNKATFDIGLPKRLVSLNAMAKYARDNFGAKSLDQHPLSHWLSRWLID